MVKTILPKGTKLWMQEISGHTHYIWYAGCAATMYMKKQIGYSYNLMLILEKDNMFTVAYEESDMIRVAKIVYNNQLKDKHYTQKLIKRWEGYVNEFYDLCDKIKKVELKTLSDEDLAEIYHEFKEAYSEEYAMPILADCVGYFCEVEIQKGLKNYLKKIGKEKEFNKHLMILTAPTEDSFIGEEKYELMKIGNKIINNENLMILFKQDSEIILKKLPKSMKKEIEEHAKKYFWIQNSYLRSIVLDEIHFIERIKNHIKNPENVKSAVKKTENQFIEIVKNKEKVMKELNVSFEFKELIKLLDEYAHWQDMRKRANLIADHYVTLFLEEIGRRKNILFETLYFTTPEEIEDLLNGNSLDWDKIELRKKINGTKFTPEKTITYDHSDALLLEKEINLQININGITDVYGTTVNVGKVIAKVKIIMNPGDFEKLEKGDILVTSMTRPEFVPILNKAVAIVTDEGGLTCHAAIISREMDIPCIVGTKIATKILKDNMLIEVNANHGVVKILK